MQIKHLPGFILVLCFALIITALALKDSEMHNCLRALIFPQTSDCLLFMAEAARRPQHMD